MTDYVPYTAAEYAPDAPATALHFQRWFENWIAGFEGAPGAPRLTYPAMGSWYSTAGDIGTYVFAARTGDVAFGATVAGSSLTPTSAARSISGLGGSNAATLNSGSALSGTWRCMGTFDQTVTSANDGSGGNNTILGATLWQRIA
ncbi:MAG: hypothetical protein MUE52_01755 [Tabrizicola sp.]|jgi:hypothetical protein|nr:hypothetical protein [Tabrizicola sp.]